MTIRTVYAAESWDKVYSAFDQINFTAYDYDTVKESLITYLKTYYPENFNDFIESSELIAVLELFAYAAELLAYRIDTMSHENFITTAQRKQSILKLASMISYKPSRNIAGRGLVKINSVKTTEDIYDSLGTNLANTIIEWNDPNNTNWKEQFILVMNSIMTTKFGQPTKSFSVNDILMQGYSLNNKKESFLNGVKSLTVSESGETLPFEIVPADLDENGPYERSPDENAQFSIMYSSDGKGDASEYTGFLMFVKQGTISKIDYTFDKKIANRELELSISNINDTDVWVYRVENDAIVEKWVKTDSLYEENIYFNSIYSSRKKYEIETRENDKIVLKFGDDNFSDSPLGQFQIWVRASSNSNINVTKKAIKDQLINFSYVNKALKAHDCNLTFSLVAPIQNNAKSETTEHVRQTAPSVFYSQNRMVNGQDYNTFMLKDPSILKLKTVNRTFSGQSKFIEFNDASGRYQNVKMFGDDLIMEFESKCQLIETKDSSRSLIDNVIEPILSSDDMINVVIQAFTLADDGYGIVSMPRRKFIEDNRLIHRDLDGNLVNVYGRYLGKPGTPLMMADGSLNEKTAIQAALDQHWYGEPTAFSNINGIRHGVIPDPAVNPKSTGKLYLADLPRTIDSVNTYPPGDLGSGVQPISRQPAFGLKYNRFLAGIGTGSLSLYNLDDASTGQVWTDDTPCPASGLIKYKHKVEVLTVEKTSDSNTFTVISNFRGVLPDYDISIGGRWSSQTGEKLPIDFIIDSTSAAQAFEAGDSFIIDISFENNSWFGRIRKFGAHSIKCVNLNGWWELIPSDVLLAPTADGGAGISRDNGPNTIQQFNYNPNDLKASWVFLVLRNDDTAGNVDSWRIYHRDISLIATSNSTKFWINNDTILIDPETKKPVRDVIRVLKSNLDEKGIPLGKTHYYDIQSAVTDSNGLVDYSKVKIVPSNILNFGSSSYSPEKINQFLDFSNDAYEFFLIDNSISSNPSIIRILSCSEIKYVSGYDVFKYNDNFGYDTGVLTITDFGSFVFDGGSNISSNQVGNISVGRRRRVPSVSVYNEDTETYECNLTTGLEFMWQHFSPSTNLIDPSVSNIHDMFLLTSGYYTQVISYLKDTIDSPPVPPTPLDLRISYNKLLTNKMISDTVIFHPGKIKLLFGNKADQKLRAKFKIIKSPNCSFSDERIKLEIVSIIDNFFSVARWDFGVKFYATELFSLIHQKLGTQISSVVLVPTFSAHSFGSLFTIEPDIDEILQSAATIDDIIIVDNLAPLVLRQNV